jgi:hypothetical protein
MDFYALRDLRAGDLVIGLPWQENEQASLQLGETRVFALMHGRIMETHTDECRLL